MSFINGRHYRMTSQSSNSVNKDHNREFWATHIEKWKQSNLKQQAYCLKEGISYGAFGYWKNLLSPKSSKNNLRKFAPVTITKNEVSQTKSHCEIQIKLVGGHIVYLPHSMDAKEIGLILHYLGTSHA